MQITINGEMFDLLSNPYISGNDKCFYYNSEPGTILIYIGVLNESLLNMELRDYFYGRKVEFIKNEYLSKKYRVRNVESGLPELDFSCIPNFPPFITKASIDKSIAEDYQIIDIDTTNGIMDSSSEDYIGQYWLIKLRKLNYFLSEVEKIKKLDNIQDSIGLAHNLIEMIVSDLCRRKGHSPTNNFTNNLDNSGISDDNLKELIKTVKRISGAVAHGNTSTPESKKESEKYHSCVIECIMLLTKTYYL